MSDKIRIVLDADGGDNAPMVQVEGAVKALKRIPQVELILCGKEDEITRELKKYTDVPMDRLRIVNCTEHIETAEPPVVAIRSKKDSSIVVGLNLLKKGEADAFVSSGSTGAVLVGGTVLVGRIRGIERAPLAVIIPNAKGVSLLIDGGANVDSRSSHLVQYAQMGSIYMEHVMGVKNPTVGIVNNGAEDDKGNALVKETFPLLSALNTINFIGSVEPRDIPSGAADVIVCDAFVGNAILKMYEGTASTLMSLMKQVMKSSFSTKIGALLLKKPLKEALSPYDVSNHGGAPMIGLKKLVVKSHGSAKTREIEKTIEQCIQFYEAHIPDRIEDFLKAQGPNQEDEGK